MKNDETPEWAKELQASQERLSEAIDRIQQETQTKEAKKETPRKAPERQGDNEQIKKIVNEMMK